MWISCEGEEFILFSFNRKFRTFELRSNLLTFGKIQIICFFARLFVTLNCVLTYSRSEKKRKTSFSFAFRSLIRNFEFCSNLLSLG